MAFNNQPVYPYIHENSCFERLLQGIGGGFSFDPAAFEGADGIEAGIGGGTPLEKPTSQIISPYDTSNSLLRESPQIERIRVNAQPSPLPDYLPPPERSPTPGRTSRSKRGERTPRPKAQATQGDAALIGFMGGLNHSDLASKAGEEPLPQESEESTDEDDEEPTNRENGETAKLARNAVSLVERCDARRDDQHGTSNNEQSESGSDSSQMLPIERGRTEALYLETPNFVNPSVKQAGVSVNGDLQGLNSQEVVEKTKRRRFTWKVCDDCHRLKRKVSVLIGWGGQHCG